MKDLLHTWIQTTRFIPHEDVKKLITYYTNLLKALQDCPEVYLLVKYDARKQLDSLVKIDKAFKDQTK